MSLPLLRRRDPARPAHVTNMELFFDLVFVFAFVELSSHLYATLSWTGAAEAAVMFAALWWAWNLTAWATGWADPEQVPVMGMLAALMLGSLIMAASIPGAFGADHGAADRGVAFAGAYATLQLGRSAFMVWALRRPGSDRDPVLARNFGHLLMWSACAAVGWLAGALLTHDPELRLGIWAAAVAVDLAGPLCGFWLPGRGAVPIQRWPVAGGHLAERCQLFLMIAFGETVLRLGEAFLSAREKPWVDVAFVLGFLTSFALWAIYFIHQADHAAERIRRAEVDAARLGRSTFAYAHGVMVAGVVALAVGEHLAVAHPLEGTTWPFMLVGCAGPGLYLVGIAGSKVVMGHGRFSVPLLGALLLVLVSVGLSFINRIAVLGGILLVAAVLAVLAERDARVGAASAASAGPD